MRVVLDTNIYIAAAFRNGFSADILQIVATIPDFSVITSEAILAELHQKLREKFDWTEVDIDQFLKRIKKFANVVGITEKIVIITRDPKDNKILECAVSGKADLIITLDQDLINLKTFRGIAIIHPKTFAWTFPEHFKKSKKN